MYMYQIPNSDVSHSGMRFSPMEIEEFKPLPVRHSTIPSDRRRKRGAGRVHPIDECLIMIRLYIEYFPKLSAILTIAIVGSVVYWLVKEFRKPVIRNRLSHDYTSIDLHYNWKASKIDHWCLWGGDESCHCDDFTDPLSREEEKGWTEAHLANVAKISRSKIYDVVFYGDDFVEEWEGTWLSRATTSEDGLRIAQHWNETFTKSGGGEFEGLALGIMGDAAPNLLWRLQNGELPDFLSTKVFWLLIGTNDLSRGGCSEEAVFLGILRLADEIHFQHPDAVVVIQGILPRTSEKEGRFEGYHTSHITDSMRHPLHRNQERARTPEEAQHRFSLWTSIQHINNQLAAFCSSHDHLVYFDANDLFLGSMGNEHYKQREKVIISDLMPDMVHPSFEGYRIMGETIQKELRQIILQRNEANRIELKAFP